MRFFAVQTELVESKKWKEWGSRAGAIPAVFGWGLGMDWLTPSWITPGPGWFALPLGYALLMGAMHFDKIRETAREIIAGDLIPSPEDQAIIEPVEVPSVAHHKTDADLQLKKIKHPHYLRESLREQLELLRRRSEIEERGPGALSEEEDTARFLRKWTELRKERARAREYAMDLIADGVLMENYTTEDVIEVLVYLESHTYEDTVGWFRFRNG